MRTPETKGRIYLAGPMTGLPEFNFPAFNEADALLTAAGWVVFNPAKKDQESGLSVEGLEGTVEELDAAGFDFAEAADWDLGTLVHRVEAIAMLPGWRKSKGARAEYAVARWLGLKVYEWNRYADGNLMLLYGTQTLHV